ncbi:MAG: hypothetical protein V7749_17135 [Cocleimonas sp.]
MINPSVAKELNAFQYDARLCSAQLLVIKGDLTRLQHKETKEHHKTGLKQRIKGALGTVGWLCRQHSSANTNNSLHKESFNKARLAFKTENLQGLHENLDSLILSMPLKVNNFEFQHLSNKTLKTSISIYKHYCQACHNQPNDKSETPAYSLFKMAKKMSREELLARILVGVHGTSKIALRNPLTDDDITGLITYFTKTKKAKH